MSRLTRAAAGYRAYTQQAIDYAEARERGEIETASAALAGLPADVQSAIQEFVVRAQSSAIALSMIVLGVVVLAGAVVAWVVIGRRRTPDHIEVTGAAEA